VFAAAGVQLAQQGTPVVRIDANGFVRERPARLGSNVLRLTGTGTNGQPRTVDIIFDIATRDRGVAGAPLPRTGAMILRWSLAGAALLAIGGALVLVDRRRRRSFDS
jgi:LPXTG-motif cell wall-anchored protein